MRLKFRRFILIVMTGAFVWAAHLCSSAAAAQDARDPYARGVDAVFADLNRKPSPGLAIAVVRDGKVVLRRGYGLASIEHRVPITPSTARLVIHVDQMTRTESRLTISLHLDGAQSSARWMISRAG